VPLSPKRKPAFIKDGRGSRLLKPKHIILILTEMTSNVNRGHVSAGKFAGGLDYIYKILYSFEYFVSFSIPDALPSL